MYFQFITLTLISQVSSQNKILLPSTENASLFECASKILRNTNTSHVLVSNGPNNIQNIFTNNPNISTILLDVNKGFSHFKTMDWSYYSYLIIGGVAEVRSFLEKSYGFAYWNPRGRFVVVSLGEGSILETLWEFYVVNVVVIRLGRKGVEVVTYFPYKDGSCGEEIKVGVTSCDILGELFPNKIPKKFNGCPIKLCVTNVDPYVINPNISSENAAEAGFEAVFVDNLVRYFNLTKQISVTYVTDYGTRLNNGTFLGPYAGIFHKHCEVAYGRTWLNHSFNLYFDHSFILYMDLFSWHVPAARIGEPWKNLVLIFQKSLWGSVLAVLVANTLVWWGFGDRRRGFSWFVLCSWYSLLCGSVRLPRGNVMRVLVIFWTIFALLLSTVYQSQLLSILTTPIYDHQISTFEELLFSSVQILYSTESLENFKQSQIWHYNELLKKGKLITAEEYSLMRKNYIPNTAYQAVGSRTKYLFSKYYLYPDNSPKVYVFPESFFWSLICMYTRKGYPLLDQFNDFLMKIVQSGLFDKWMEDTAKPIDKITPSGPKKLNLIQLTGAFFLLLLGLLISTIVFIGEIIGQKFRN